VSSAKTLKQPDLSAFLRYYLKNDAGIGMTFTCTTTTIAASGRNEADCSKLYIQGMIINIT
jgi:hypothetical protein